ncbi:hypothetical protein COO60DRAFT_1633269 [Scenedesmus sp. NREL 46B-D3]|nr:hypothetical protein COO60DRAFT_1633269 [Scenedesmus sp. NREL 46B-D3]
METCLEQLKSEARAARVFTQVMGGVWSCMSWPAAVDVDMLRGAVTISGYAGELLDSGSCCAGLSLEEREPKARQLMATLLGVQACRTELGGRLINRDIMVSNICHEVLPSGRDHFTAIDHGGICSASGSDWFCLIDTRYVDLYMATPYGPHGQPAVYSAEGIGARTHPAMTSSALGWQCSESRSSSLGQEWLPSGDTSSHAAGIGLPGTPPAAGSTSSVACTARLYPFADVPAQHFTAGAAAQAGPQQHQLPGSHWMRRWNCQPAAAKARGSSSNCSSSSGWTHSSSILGAAAAAAVAQLLHLMRLGSTDTFSVMRQEQWVQSAELAYARAVGCGALPGWQAVLCPVLDEAALPSAAGAAAQAGPATAPANGSPPDVPLEQQHQQQQGEVTGRALPPCLASSSSSRGRKAGTKGLRRLLGGLQRAGGRVPGALRGRGRQAGPPPAS